MNVDDLYYKKLTTTENTVSMVPSKSVISIGLRAATELIPSELFTASPTTLLSVA